MQKIKESSTATEAKRINQSVNESVGWNEDNEAVIQEIIMCKVDQVKDFRTKLEIANTKTVFAEATFDSSCGTGLDVTSTKGTNPSRWPEDFKLGLIVKRRLLSVIEGFGVCLCRGEETRMKTNLFG